VLSLNLRPTWTGLRPARLGVIPWPALAFSLEPAVGVLAKGGTPLVSRAGALVRAFEGRGNPHAALARGSALSASEREMG
jgi:hypothetical protein